MRPPTEDDFPWIVVDAFVDAKKELAALRAQLAEAQADLAAAQPPAPATPPGGEE